MMEKIRIRDMVEAVGGQLLLGDENQEIAHISLNSREMEGQDLFVPIVGERVDAHNFICQALDNGAAAVFTSRHHSRQQAEEEIRAWEAHEGRPVSGAWIQVEDTKKALQDLGAWRRRQISIPLVGITGSVGKTTTREMVAAALGAGFQVYKTPGNANSQVGVPITICSIPRDAQIGVIELGMSQPGEMERIARVAQVDSALITNIGDAHIQQLGSRENILKEKLYIQDGMNPKGKLFLNGDDPLLCKAAASEGREVVYYGTSPQCQYQAKDLHLEDGYPVFRAVHQDQQVCVRLKVMGTHMAQNAMAALAVAGEYGVPLEQAARELENYQGSKGRQQIYEIGGMVMIDDSYNASPASMKAGLQVLHSMKPGARKIAVLADMKELGPKEGEFHREIGSFLARQPVDLVLLLGDLAQETGREMSRENPQAAWKHFSDLDSLIRFLKETAAPGDCIFFKGSNSMRLGDAVAQLMDSLKQTEEDR